MFTLSRRLSTFTKRECYVKNVRLTQAFKEGKADLLPYLDTGKVLLFHKSKVLVSQDKSKTPLWQEMINLTEAFPTANVRKDSVFLGLDSTNVARFAVHFSAAQMGSPEICEERCQGRLTDFRYVMLQATPADARLLAQANALLSWNHSTKFCSSCGASLSRNTAGSQKSCSSCKSVSYPNMSPVGIVLVTNETRTKLFLVRQPRHPLGMFTCIAGFMDMGETLEETIKREVAEEIGLLVKDIRYKSSQHWPFPKSSIMFGCEAVVEDENQAFSLDKSELEDGRWFSRSEIEKAIETIKKNPSSIVGSGENIFVPPARAIAHQMIKAWLDDS